ncbi:hypothetical protein [Plesiomonas shigelloides]|uniref:hypothetical protein n=1 Tax=Plesiomonas shigelloides TaxID=703 RepID=UPI001E4C11D3|nr:hypothetical protein [Plesiomonas shigelloides]MCQ8859825.1 hypothetical protein [Plesiomonas shigelloides]
MNTGKSAKNSKRRRRKKSLSVISAGLSVRDIYTTIMRHLETLAKTQGSDNWLR